MTLIGFRSNCPQSSRDGLLNQSLYSISGRSRQLFTACCLVDYLSLHFRSKRHGLGSRTSKPAQKSGPVTRGGAIPLSALNSQLLNRIVG